MFSDILIYNAHKMVSLAHRISHSIRSLDKNNQNEIGISLSPHQSNVHLHKAHSLGALHHSQSLPSKEVPVSMNDIEAVRSSFVNVTTMEDLLREPFVFLTTGLPNFVTETI